MVSTSEGNFVSIQFMFSYCYINNLYNLIVHEAGKCLFYMTITIIIRLYFFHVSLYYKNICRPMFFVMWN